jgi:hypothetical protein
LPDVPARGRRRGLRAELRRGRFALPAEVSLVVPFEEILDRLAALRAKALVQHG